MTGIRNRMLKSSSYPTLFGKAIQFADDLARNKPPCDHQALIAKWVKDVLLPQLPAQGEEPITEDIPFLKLYMSHPFLSTL